MANNMGRDGQNPTNVSPGYWSSDGMAFIPATVATPLPVSALIASGSPVLSSFSTSPVSVNDTADLLATANTSREAISFYNAGADEVMISPEAGITTSDYLVLLSPGDYYDVDDLRAQSAWYGVCNTGESAAVKVGLGVRV